MVDPAKVVYQVPRGAGPKFPKSPVKGETKREILGKRKKCKNDAELEEQVEFLRETLVEEQ